MRRYKKLTHITRLQSRLDSQYGKGQFHAVFILALFFCLFFTSCANDTATSQGTSGRTVNPPINSAEGAQSRSDQTRARINITDTNQTRTPTNLPHIDFPVVLDAYFAKEDSGEYQKIKSAAMGDTVYVVVDTTNLNGRELQLTIKDGNNIIKNAIPFLQYKETNGKFADKPEDVSGKFTASVRNVTIDQCFAVYKIALKGNDDATTTKWKTDIKNHTEKKLKLCLEVKVTGEDKDNVIYCGSNFTDAAQQKTDSEKNVWLNQTGKWFEVDTDCFCSDLKIDTEGFISGGEAIKYKIAECNNGSKMSEVKIIVLHRTSGGVASGTLSHMKEKKYGAHFVIDNALNTDGKIYHAISTHKAGSHMGAGQYKITKDNKWGNHNSIGIEVCGYAYTSDGKKRVGANGSLPHGYWQEVTEKQAKSLSCLVKFLLEHYKLTIDDVKCHEDLCAKDPNEGREVYNAMMKHWHGN